MEKIFSFLVLTICLLGMVESKGNSSRFKKSEFTTQLTINTLQTPVLKDTSITVYGNCSSCKKNIEKAAKSVEGVESASWDKKKKILSVQFDEAKTSLNMIEKAIIAIGYDTENMHADDAVYEELHHCCKYDRKPR